MSWVDQLAEHGKKRKRKATSDKPVIVGPPPPVQEVIVSVRPANDRTGDPGEAAIGWYIVQDGVLTMTDENAKPSDKPETALVTEGMNVEVVAARLTKKRWMSARSENDDFNRPIFYGKAFGVV